MLGFLHLIEPSGSWGGSWAGPTLLLTALSRGAAAESLVRELVAPLSARPLPPVAPAPAMKRFFSCSSSQVAVGANMSGRMGLGCKPW